MVTEISKIIEEESPKEMMMSNSQTTLEKEKPKKSENKVTKKLTSNLKVATDSGDKKSKKNVSKPNLHLNLGKEIHTLEHTFEFPQEDIGIEKVDIVKNMVGEQLIDEEESIMSNQSPLFKRGSKKKIETALLPEITH